MNKTGFALIMAIFLAMFFALTSLSLWHNISQYFEIVFEQEKFYKNFYLADCLLNYAVKIAQNNFDNIYEHIKKTGGSYSYGLDKHIDLINKNIDKNHAYNYFANCYFDKLQKSNNKSLLIEVYLHDINTKKQLFCISCEFEKITQNIFIKNFKIA